jgi:hypothetical protein
MSDEITKVPGMHAEIQGPARGGPFSTLNVSWTLPITGGEAGRMLPEGDTRILSHAEGDRKSFLIRPVAMKPGEHKIVARRLREIFSSAASQAGDKSPALAVFDISGAWDVEIRYEVGAARHKLFRTAKGNRVAGSPEGRTYLGDLTGEVSGQRVMLRSSLPAEGDPLASVCRDEIEIWGCAKFHARRHA